MKYHVKISNLSFDIELTPIGGTTPIEPIEPPVVTPWPPIDNKPIELDWMDIVSKVTYTLKEGNYHVSNWTKSDKDLELFGEGEVNVYFGDENYSEWDGKGYQERFLFDVNRPNAKVLIDGVNIYSASTVQEVQPFFMTVFTGSAIGQDLTLKNLKTNMEIGLLYSASQEVTQNVKAENVDFTGIIWQELKANNGGGLKSTMRNCELNQVDPITHFKTLMSVDSNSKVTSHVSFNRIDNQFNSWGNSCNILFIDGMTFYLPKTDEKGYTHSIRPIPNVGDVINLTSTGQFLRTTENSLQVGDIIDIEGLQYTIQVKDRPPGETFANSGYGIDLNVGQIPFKQGKQLTATVVKSNGLNLIGKSFLGYMIFKYNKHFQTNLQVDHGLDYMLSSNPFGVLSYNHKEITADWENVKHNGYYRQTSSGVGYSNGYRLVNCEGFGDEFNPD